MIIPIMLGLIFIISPIITSLINQDQLLVLQDEEYKDLFKMIIFSPCLFFFMNKDEYKDKILNSIIIFYFIFGLYFLYRFLILHEVRDFDQRPLLRIRHGDANFLCTFFSMMVPLPLMQAWKAHNKKQILATSLFLLAGLFFFICAFLTESRMGLISIVIGIIYLLTRPILPFSKSMLLIIFFLFASITIALNGERLLQRFADIEDKSNTDRYLTWQNGWQVFKDNPVVGAGIHKAKDFFYQNTNYPPFQSEFKPLEVHNTFLKVAAELGLIGLCLFMLLFLWPWIKSFKRSSSDRYFLLCSMIILTLSIMTIGLVYKDLFVLHLFIIAALATSPTVKELEN
jgi:O-antigen ligase